MQKERGRSAAQTASNCRNQHIFLLYIDQRICIRNPSCLAAIAVFCGCTVGVCRTWSNFSSGAVHMTQGLAIRTIYISVLGRIKTTCASAKHRQVSVVTGHTKGHESLAFQRFTIKTRQRRFLWRKMTIAGFYLPPLT